MMSDLEQILLGGHALFWGACLIITIYLIVKQSKARKTEDFEDRDN